MRKLIAPILIVIFLLLTTLAIIAFGRGYRPDFAGKTLSSTGLLVASSDPTGAEVFIDGTLKSATNTTLTLAPGWYDVKIAKDGFITWQKRIKVQGEVVSETKAMLFPSAPALSPLTTDGAIAPIVSPDGNKIAYAIPPENVKAGLWVLNLTSQPLGFSRDPQTVSLNANSGIDFSNSTFSWSPDSQQILVSYGANYYLLDSSNTNTPTLLSPQALQILQTTWTDETNKKDLERLTAFPPEFTKIATESAKILSFSYDETKVLYRASDSSTLPLKLIKNQPIGTNPTQEERTLKEGEFYVYDLKEDKNFRIDLGNDNVASLSWLPSSRHLIEVTSDKISILEYDGSNKTTVYSGPFAKFLAPTLSGNKLLILTTLNRLEPDGTGPANLYSVNLR